jgi:hypothetical protein
MLFGYRVGEGHEFDYISDGSASLGFGRYMNEVRMTL